MQRNYLKITIPIQEFPIFKSQEIEKAGTNDHTSMKINEPIKYVL